MREHRQRDRAFYEEFGIEFGDVNGIKLYELFAERWHKNEREDKNEKEEKKK
ncbi:hypothetical protein [Bacillus sp. FJAT-27225]|uniref:hypothetical protein n=1 Tax=Bacillus sp. FJAT-27225 TaxID=1743144 RepID=UPI0015860572|nr:hypothetical protein [Bacillus sp. FJAT-27225]